MMRERMRTDLEAIFRAAVAAVDPVAAVRQHLRREGDLLHAGDPAAAGLTVDLTTCERVFVVGAGKAAALMASAVEGILGDRVTRGSVNVKYGHVAPLRKVRLQEAGHPVPDENGVRGAKRIADIAAAAAERDLVIALISGGGSAIMPLPAHGISLREKQEVTKHLLACGATINELNAARKHLSALKGGRLARLASPARLITLILSDVVGDPLDVIASGPTAADTSTFADCLDILTKYKLHAEIPGAALNHLRRGADGEIEESPKPGDPAFQKTTNVIVASNRVAVAAAAKKAEELGWNPHILGTRVEGEARDVARGLMSNLRECAAAARPVPPPVCFLAAGETTVTVRGRGRGGRSQEMALAAAMTIEGEETLSFLAAGTDGTDGPTDAAGAFADGSTVRRAREQGLDPAAFLRDNDSYHFFRTLGDLLITGPTGTNVMDLYIGLVCERETQ